MSCESATVSFRTEAGVAEDEPWTVVDSAELSNTLPWRKVRWYKSQRHYSGMYWSATMRDHMVYESRLELARLIFVAWWNLMTDVGRMADPPAGRAAGLELTQVTRSPLAATR